jgi:hypothetical protein
MKPEFSKKRSFIMRNLAPQSVRRSLRRVINKSFWGGVEIEATLRDGKTIDTFTCGEVRGGALVGTEVHGPGIEGIRDLSIPVAEIVRLQVTYDPAVIYA